jgi:hypothetical protein
MPVADIENIRPTLAMVGGVWCSAPQSSGSGCAHCKLDIWREVDGKLG